MTSRAVPSRRTPARVSSRVGAVLACAVLALGLAGCGDDDSDSQAGSGDSSASDGSGDGASTGSGDSSGSGTSAGSDASDASGRSAPAGTPEEAYANFAGAIESDDADAFDAAVVDKYWSDLTDLQEDNAANLAAHHWAVENGVMSLPADPEKVLTGDEAVGAEGEPGDADGFAAKIGTMLGIEGLSGDDLAIVTVADAFDNGLANRAEAENCIEDDKAIDECLDDTSSSGREDVSVILIRGDDGWQVFGTEPAN